MQNTKILLRSVWVCGLFAAWGAPADCSDYVPIVATVEEIADQITRISGAAEGDGFASVLVNLGDINGDGYEDIAFWGATGTEGEENTAYILFGTAEFPRTLALEDFAAWGIRLHSAPGRRVPMPRPVGDLDGDGYADMIFRACDKYAAAPCGAMVIFGGPDLPREIDTHTFEGCRRLELSLDRSATQPYLRSFSAGDVNGDGLLDLIIGADGAYTEGYPESAGIVYVILGTRPLPASIDLTDVGASVPGCKITSGVPGGHLTGCRLGYNVDARRDFNADGSADLAIAAPRWDREDGPGMEYGGAVFVVYGRPQWPAFLDLGLPEDRAQAVCFITGRNERAWLGQRTLEAAEDLTGDGRADLLVSDAVGGARLIPGAALVTGVEIAASEVSTMTAMNLHHGQQSKVGSLREIGDWNGDGRNDILAAVEGADSGITGQGQAGAVYFLTGAEELSGQVFCEAFHSVAETRAFAWFGREVVAADLTGNGRKDLVVAAPGAPGRTLLGHLYLIPHGVELLGPLVCGEYAPHTATLSAEGRMFLSGRGFDATTHVFIGDAQAEVLLRPDSRRMIARIPSSAHPASYTVRLTRGEDVCVFADGFRYYESVFPREIDVADFADHGVILIASGCPNPRRACFAPSTSAFAFEGGHDITGNGLGDVLFTRRAGHPPSERICEVFLLHGTRETFPPTIRVPEDFSHWGTTFRTNPLADCAGEFFGHCMSAVGDLNGDGISELAIATALTGIIYVIYGGPLPKGEVLIDELIAQGRAFKIVGVPYEPGINISDGDYFRILGVGDVNGDGFGDAAIVLRVGREPENDLQRGIIAFILGRREFPQELAFDALPHFYGKAHSVGSSIFFVIRAGDVDGDGLDDVLYLADTRNPQEPGDDPQSTDICIWFGREAVAQRMTHDEELLTGGACRLVETGSAPVAVGDQNGDGRADIGFKTHADPQRLLILYGRPRHDLCRLRSISRPGDFDVIFETSPGYHGALLSNISSGRDFSGDGVDDILLCDRHLPSEGPPPARAIALFGGNLEEKAGPLSAVEECLQLLEYRCHQGPGQTFPLRFDFAGDVNGDGYEDLVAYAMHEVYVYFNPLGKLKGAFIRGDANQDLQIDIADAIAVLTYLFAGARPLPCFAAADANNDDQIDIADAITILTHLFVGGAPLPPPNECGLDPDGGVLGCADPICR